MALSGKGNDKYLFTDTKTDLNSNLTADPVTWIFDTNDKQLTLKNRNAGRNIQYLQSPKD